MFEAEKNRRIIADLMTLAGELAQITHECEQRQTSPVGKVTPVLSEFLSRADTHIRQMAHAKIRHDEILGLSDGKL